MRRSCFSEWISTSEASMSKKTGPVLVTAERSHTRARTLAISVAILDRVSLLISCKLRCSVESEATKPNSAASARRCSISAQLSPPPARNESRLDEDLAPVVNKRWPLWDRGRKGVTETQPVGERAKSVQADVRHDTGPAGFHLHARLCWYRSSWKCPSREGYCCSTQSVSLVGRAFPRIRADQVTRTRE